MVYFKLLELIHCLGWLLSLYCVMYYCIVASVLCVGRSSSTVVVGNEFGGAVECILLPWCCPPRNDTNVKIVDIAAAVAVAAAPETTTFFFWKFLPSHSDRL
jgi:hypothetical protein